MNATELFHKDGKPANVFYCSECRIVKLTKEEADSCCAPRICEDCGKEHDRKFWTLCNDCGTIRDEKREAERFEEALKITKWDGWVFLDGTGDDGFSDNVSSFMDEWADEHEDSEPPPKYVWTCKENHFAVARAQDIAERIAENSYEGFELDDLNGMDDLKAAIEKFNRANEDIVSYEPDYRTAILLKP